MVNKKCSFQRIWLQKDPFKSWISLVEEDVHSAYCKLCSKNFSLSNMGEKALVSHMNGANHQQLFSASRSSSLPNFFPPASSVSESIQSSETESKSALPSKPEETSHAVTPHEISSSVSEQPLPVKPPKSKKLTSMLSKDQVTKAEILWCMNVVVNHNSQRSAGEAVQLFPKMFPDSEIASKIQLQRSKIGYTINYGLAPYFLREFQDICDKCDFLVVGFDESLNKVSQKGQMDLFVRFWDSKNNNVCTRYYNSAFLGHATAKDLEKSFTEAMKGLNIKKVLQISMDGPNVNKKFFTDLKAKLKEEDPDGPVPLNLGTCGLHQIHNSYKKAMKINKWKTIEFLRSLYYLFCYSPARREDYTKASGSNVFPLKFCVVRWTENFDVAARALQIIPHVRKYIAKVRKDLKIPTCNSFNIVESALKDKFLEPKLAFFQTVASDVKVFLKRFQGNEPLAPLLYEALVNVIHSIMTRFVKEEVLDCTSNLLKLDLKDIKNLTDLKNIDLGFSTRKALHSAGIKPVEELQFRKECREALVEFCISILHNCPLLYPVTKGISVFDPCVAINPALRTSRLNTALDAFVDCNWMSGGEADRVKQEFRAVTKLSFFDETVKSFTNKQRLDDFWLKKVIPVCEFQNLRSFLKKVLILSHGNAFAERGFSINKEILLVNLSEESLVAQRQLYDAVKYHGGILEVELTKNIIHAARNARGFYDDALKENAKKKTEEAERRAEKRKKSDEMKELEKKKRRILEDARQKIEELNVEMKKIQS